MVEMESEEQKRKGYAASPGFKSRESSGGKDLFFRISATQPKPAKPGVVKDMSVEISLEKAFLSTRYACIYMDPATMTIMDANLAAQGLFGMDRRSLVSRNISDLILNEKDSFRNEITATLFKKKGIILKLENATTGNVVELQARVVPFTSERNEGRLALVAPLRPMEEKETAKPNPAEVFASSLLEAIPDGAALIDTDGNIVTCNWKFQQMWRIPRLYLEKGNEGELSLHMARLVKEGERLAQNPEGLLAYFGEDRVDRVSMKDGRTLEFLCRKVAYGDQEKNWIIIFKDVSSTYEVETMLYTVLQELGAIMDASRMGVVMVKKGKITRASSKAEKMLGYGKKEMEGMNAQSLFPHEKGKDHLSTGSGETLPDGVFMSERLFARKDGAQFWATLTGRALDHKAPAAGAVWVIDDITEMKRADEKIRMSTTVFENINEGIIISDNKGLIQFVNPAFTKVTGYLPEDVIGKRPSILQSGRHDKDFYHEMWKKLVDNGGWQGEIWNRRKSGEIYAEWLSITAMKNTHGETTHYAGVFNDITYKKDNEELVHHLAFHDPLTHLPNRRMFLERMDVELAHAKREGAQLAIIFLDLDNFKQVNDILGHNAGDMVLQLAAKSIQSALRESDSVSRFGGDEFTVMVPKLRNAQDAGDVARKILDSFSSSEMVVGTDRVRVQASLGISIYPIDGLTGEDLINKADRAMYFAKKEKKGTFRFYDHKTML